VPGYQVASGVRLGCAEISDIHRPPSPDAHHDKNTHNFLLPFEFHISEKYHLHSSLDFIVINPFSGRVDL